MTINIHNETDFTATALDTFRYQYENNEVYHRFCTLLQRTPEKITVLEHIPFLPIECFKTHKVYCGSTPHQQIFTSSGTTGAQTSQHYVKDLSIYEESFRKGFAYFYGDIRDYVVLASWKRYNGNVLFVNC